MIQTSSKVSIVKMVVTVGLIGAIANTPIAAALPEGRLEEHSIPTFSILDLQTIASSIRKYDGDDQNIRMKEFRETLSTTGLLAVSLDNLGDDSSIQPEYSEHRSVAMDGLCSCIDHPSFLELDQTHQLVLQNSQTVRTSVATASVGLEHPLPLPQGLETICGSHIVEAMDYLRDEVSSVSKAFVTALDGSLAIQEKDSKTTPKALLRDKHGKTYETISDIVQSANHLEHFHVYTNNNDENPVAWDWHTDAGLFLVFVPAWDCNGSNHHQDESFYYRSSTGMPIRARFDGSRTAIVMLGQGAQDWISHTNKQPLLKATTHSVRWSGALDSQLQQRRSWYGMMHLVPENSMIYGPKTLADVKKSLSLTHQSKMNFQPSLAHPSAGVSLGCGDISLPAAHDTDEVMTPIVDDVVTTSKNRKRHLAMQDPSMCNNVTNFFCWMTCMDIPEIDHAEVYVEAGYSLYCVDESVMSSSGNNVTKAHAPCVDIHNAGCKGFWEKTTDGVPSAKIEFHEDIESIEYPFCYGGTTMFMEGFQWIQSSTCVVLLFPSFVLNSASKYAAAAIGTILAAIGLEKFIQLRRKTMACMGSGVSRLVVSAMFYGAQLSIGYLLMLVIMIYSGVLFLSVILGLVIGHVMFNAKDALWPIDEDALASPDDDIRTEDEKSNSTQPHKLATKSLQTTRLSSTKRLSLSLSENGEERAIREGSTHCQDFDGSFEVDYYGSLENTTEIRPAPASLITTTAIKKNTRRNSELDQGVLEGSTPCCQHGL